MEHPLTGADFDSPVPPGAGWPEDPAATDTPVATTPAAVRRAAEAALDGHDLAGLEAQVSVCRACHRLVRWREEVARDKRASFAEQPYWGRPIAGWGDPRPRLLLVGLAPAAHGGNRTGRVFTGDSSGDWLFASLHRVGLAVLPTSSHAGDGQRLIGTRMIAAVRCAPPQNKPTTTERDTCAPWLSAEIRLVAPSVRVVVALGGFGWAAALRGLADAGFAIPRPRPRFGHEASVELSDGERQLALVGCYHPSQHNTFTGRLTPQMLDDVLGRSGRLAGLRTKVPRLTT